MDSILCGISHKEIALREQVSFTDVKKMQLQEELREINVQEVLILSTCNRSQILCLGETNTLRRVPSLYQTFFSLDSQAELKIVEGEEAVAYFYTICAGLDSVLVGEDQILHQVKQAYAFACDSGCAGKAMHTLVQKVFHFTKKLKDRLKISEHPLNSSYVAMKRLKQEVSLTGKRVLLSGGGEIIQQCIPYLIEEKLASIDMLVRSIEKQRDIQTRYPYIQRYPFTHRYELWQNADIIISATSSPHVLFSIDRIPKAQKEKWVLDLAMPRDVDARLKTDPLLHIYDIDELQATLDEHAQDKQAAIQEAKKRILEEAKTSYQQLTTHSSSVLIQDFQQHLLSRAEDTYRLLAHKLSLAPHEQTILKKTLEYSYLRFLHDWLMLVNNSDEEKQAILMELIQKYKER